MLAVFFRSYLVGLCPGKMQLGEPLKNGISDFRPTGFAVILNERNVCMERASKYVRGGK